MPPFFFLIFCALGLDTFYQTAKDRVSAAWDLFLSYFSIFHFQELSHPGETYHDEDMLDEDGIYVSQAPDSVICPITTTELVNPVRKYVIACGSLSF